MNSEHQLQGQLTRHTAEIADILRRLNDNGKPSLLGVTEGGTGTSTRFTQGSLVFAGGSGVYTEDNANLFYDNSTNKTGFGTATPKARLSIKQSTDDFIGGLHLTESATADTWSMCVKTDESLHFGYATAASGADAAADFTTAAILALKGTQYNLILTSDPTNQYGVITSVSDLMTIRGNAYFDGTNNRTVITGRSTQILTSWSANRPLGVAVDVTSRAADGIATLTEVFGVDNGGSVVIRGAGLGGGTGIIAILNASANPSSNPAGGGVLYCDAGALKYRGSSGSVSTIAPA